MDNELYHWGIKGQKWGVRRYQNSDGSLTPAGREHYADSDGSSRKSIGQSIKDRRTANQRKKNLAKARQAKVEKQKAAAERKRLIDNDKIKAKDMTDDEIKQRIERINLEKSYKEAMRNSRSYDKGKRYVDKFMDSTIDKLADNVTADLITQALKVVGAKGTNDLLEKSGFDRDVYTNNKKNKK